MIPASPHEPIAVFIQFASEWLRLLAKNAFVEAAARLDEPNGYGERWSAEKIQSVIEDYARSELVQVTDPDTLVGDGHPSLVALADGSGYSFEYDVPLSDAWSDLTLQFVFLHRPAGYAVILHDIHVL